MVCRALCDRGYSWASRIHRCAFMSRSRGSDICQKMEKEVMKHILFFKRERFKLKTTLHYVQAFIKLVTKQYIFISVCVMLCRANCISNHIYCHITTHVRILPIRSGHTKDITYITAEGC